MIPDQAVEAAAKAIFLTDYAHMGPEAWETARLDGNNDRPDAYNKAEAALQAALPEIETAIRAQVATEIRDSAADMQDAADTFAVGAYTGTIALKAEGMYQAARITEKRPTK